MGGAGRSEGELGILGKKLKRGYFSESSGRDLHHAASRLPIKQW
jgi:hypothetical protein